VSRLNTPHNLNPKIEEIVRTSKKGIQDLPVTHILPSCAHNLVDAFGSRTFTASTSRIIAQLHNSDPESFKNTIELMRKARGTYEDGESELKKIRDKLPKEVNDAYREFISGNAEWKHFHDACKTHGITGADELIHQLETHTRRKDLAEKLIVVLEKAHNSNISGIALQKQIQQVFYPHH